MNEPPLFAQFGDFPGLTEETMASVEQLFFGIYGYGRPHNKGCQIEDDPQGESSVDALPLTLDALDFKFDWGNYQAFIWKQAVEPNPYITPSC